MRILVVHNRYQQAGGEDAVVAAEMALLTSAGIDVSGWQVDNDNIRGPAAMVATGLTTAYNTASREALGREIDRFRPDVVHIHNTFPRLSPAVFDACLHRGVPSVATLHNYRTICANALLMRNGVPCELCVTGSPYQAILHGCYRGSRLASAPLAQMIHWHRRRQTWSTKVDGLIALTDFARDRFLAAGFLPDNLHVKPNFVNDPGQFHGARAGALFVGRLSEEKGLRTLIQAWAQVDEPLDIVGDGPLLSWVRRAAPENVRVHGGLGKAAVLAMMQKARALVVPSLWYEGFPMVVVEGLANGLPILASRIGALEEIVGTTGAGAVFEPGDATSLSSVVNAIMSNESRRHSLGEAARAAYEKLYTPAMNLSQLLAIYRAAAARARARM